MFCTISGNLESGTFFKFPEFPFLSSFSRDQPICVKFRAFSFFLTLPQDFLNSFKFVKSKSAHLFSSFV